MSGLDAPPPWLVGPHAFIEGYWRHHRFEVQYQQTPIPPDGTIIKRKWLATYDEIASRPGDRIVMSWDIALSEIESGDYSACVVLLIRNEIVYILDVVRGRFPFETLKKKVMELKRRYSPSTC